MEMLSCLRTCSCNANNTAFCLPSPSPTPQFSEANKGDERCCHGHGHVHATQTTQLVALLGLESIPIILLHFLTLIVTDTNFDNTEQALGSNATVLIID